MPGDDVEMRLRTVAMDWLDRRANPAQPLVTFEELAQFHFDGQRVPLMDRQRGIRKPRFLEAALSIRTVFTPPGQEPPYQDTEGPDGFVRYAYRGNNPDHPENVALRRAYERGLPLVWFVAIARGVYEPIYPVWLVGDERDHLRFVVAVDSAQRLVSPGEADNRQYVERLNRLRLHQPVFRARVLSAYRTQCTVCRLRHSELLDAAHILPDTHPRGNPIVPNGLAMCKIHHAAYDRNILGVRPDLVVEIRSDILAEVDGPMLRHGLQDMDGTRLIVPQARDARPDAVRLEERYEEFRLAG